MYESKVHLYLQINRQCWPIHTYIIKEFKILPSLHVRIGPRQDGRLLLRGQVRLLGQPNRSLELAPHLLELSGERLDQLRHRRQHNVLPVAGDRLHRPVHRAGEQDAAGGQPAELIAAEHAGRLAGAALASRRLAGGLEGGQLRRRSGIDQAELVMDEAVVFDREADRNGWGD